MGPSNSIGISVVAPCPPAPQGGPLRAATALRENRAWEAALHSRQGVGLLPSVLDREVISMGKELAVKTALGSSSLGQRSQGRAVLARPQDVGRM